MMLPQALHRVPAPAKLNLFLHITGRLPNGYHQLQSVFMLIDWMDSIDFIPTADGCITRTEEGCAPLPADDLCTRAARTLQQATGCRMGVQMHVRKAIPAEAGMGGGSSDAATCLLALNRLWNLQLSRTQLSQIGVTLGADVPFFLFGHNAWAEGIGDELQAVDLPIRQWLVVKPPQGASTAAIFSAPDLARNTVSATMRDFVAQADPFTYGHNDLQPVASRLCPDIQTVMDWMQQQGLKARMTGSGSAVFAALPASHSSADVLRQNAPKNWNIRVCSNLNAHPLLQWAA